MVHRVFLGLWGEEMDGAFRGLKEVMGSGERKDGGVRLKLLVFEGERQLVKVIRWLEGD